MFRHFRMIRGCRCPAPRPPPRSSTTAKGGLKGHVRTAGAPFQNDKVPNFSCRRGRLPDGASDAHDTLLAEDQGHEQNI